MPNFSNLSLVESVYSLNARYSKELLPLTFVFGFLAFAGVFGNTLVLIVFSRSREYKKTNFKVYALFHGVIDLFICLTVIPGDIFKLRHYFSFKNGTACKAFCFFNTFGAGTGALILMLISVERFLRVNRPLGTQISPRLAVRLCLICLFAALLLASPTALVCGIEEASITNIHGGNTTVYLCLAEEKFKNSVWRMTYKISMLILSGLVLVTCIVMYVCIWRKVYAATRMHMGQECYRMRATKTKKHFDSKEEKFTRDKNVVEVFKGTFRKENIITRNICTVSRTHSEILHNGSSQSTDSDPIGQFPYKTVIWFVLTVIFIATRIEYGALLLFHYAIISLPPKLFALSSFFYRLYFINSVINPLVYALLDRRFRCICRRIFRERICF